MQVLRIITTIFIFSLLFSSSVKAENIERFEVDGVAIGDSVKDTMEKLNIKPGKGDRSHYFGDYRDVTLKDELLAEKISAKSIDHAKKDWNSAGPSKLRAGRQKLSSRSKAGFEKYTAHFDHNRKLLELEVLKTYHYNFKMSELYEKMLAKYGSHLLVQLKTMLKIRTSISIIVI